jgi:hypothetical protein
VLRWDIARNGTLRMRWRWFGNFGARAVEVELIDSVGLQRGLRAPVFSSYYHRHVVFTCLIRAFLLSLAMSHLEP